MNAICGIYYFDGRLAEEQELDGMLDVLAHRGPDGCGKWVTGAVGLGCQISRTTPESVGEKLPYFENHGNLAITANARIDNREELAARLALPASSLLSIPDSVLILKAYQKWSCRCVDYLLGEFVFAIWDGNSRELSCYSDHMGIRPLYYYRNERFIAIASECKALLTLQDVPGVFNERRMANSIVYALRFMEKEQTFYRDVYQLKAGTILRAGKDKFSLEEYWQPGAIDLGLNSEEEYYEAFRDIFSQAVLCRARSAYPVASLLSGGLDSASIACVASRELAKRGQTLMAISSVLPENHAGPETDESEFIRLVDAQENITVNYTYPAYKDYYDHLEEFFFISETPDIAHHEYLAYEFYKMTAEAGARTLLCGAFGEMTGSSYALGYLGELFCKGDWALMAKEIYRCSRVEKRRIRGVIVNDLLYFLMPERLWRSYVVYQHRSTGSPLEQSMIRREFAQRERVEERLQDYGEIDGWMLESSPNVLANELKDIARLRHPRAVFSLLHGVDRVYPFFDKRLVEFCLSAPPALKVKNGWRRNLLRSSMEGILPREIQWRTCKGSYIPDMQQRLHAGMKSTLREFDSLQGNDPVWEYLDRNEIQKSLEAMKRKLALSTPNVGGFDAIFPLERAVKISRFLRWFQG